MVSQLGLPAGFGASGMQLVQLLSLAGEGVGAFVGVLGALLLGRWLLSAPAPSLKLGAQISRLRRAASSHLHPPLNR